MKRALKKLSLGVEFEPAIQILDYKQGNQMIALYMSISIMISKSFPRIKACFIDGAQDYFELFILSS